MLFSNHQNIRFWSEGCSKFIFYEGSYNQILISIVLNALPHFPRNRFQLCHSKTCKKLNNALLKHSQYSFWRSRYLQNSFLRSFLWPKFDLNSVERFASLCQKIIWTLSLKNLQKTGKWNFQTLWTFVFEFQVVPTGFPKKGLRTEFWF